MEIFRISALSYAPTARPRVEIALYGKPPQNADFPANGAAGFSRGVRLYGKQFLSVHPPALLRLGQHGRHVTFQLAEIAIPRRLFAEILRLIDGLGPKAALT